MQSTSRPAVEANPVCAAGGAYNIKTALDNHCGALAGGVEVPSHQHSARNRQGAAVRHSADRLLDEELVIEEEAMKYLAYSGGRARWAGGK